MMLFQTDAFNVPVRDAFDAIVEWSAAEGAAADADGIIDGGACSASETVEILPDEGHETLPACRNVTAKPGGTTANIKAVAVTVYGTDINGDPQVETLPAFTADSATAVTGVKCFKTIDHISVPAMDGAGVTVDLGWGNVYGLPFKFTSAPIALGSVDGVSKTLTFTVAEGQWTTVAFQTAPSNKAAKVVLFY